MLNKMKTLFTEPIAEENAPQSDALHIAAAASRVAKVLVLKNRACHSHLSTRMAEGGDGFMGF